MKAIFILFALLLSGCASVDIRNAEEVRTKVSIQKDDFKKVSLYQAPRFEHKGTWMYLRAAQTFQGQPLTSQLVVILDTYGWSFYDTAYDSDGKKLDVTVLDRSVFSCSSKPCLNIETVAVNFPAGYLASHASSGLKIQVSGKGGSTVVEVPGTYVTGFTKVASFAR